MHQRERDHLEPYGVGPVLATEAPKQPAAEEELPREEVDCRVDDESPGRSACDRLGVVGAEVRLPTDDPDHDRHDGDADDGDWQAAAPVAQGEPVAARVLAPGQNLSLIHISEPTRLGMISYAVFCLKKKQKKTKKTKANI